MAHAALHFDVSDERRDALEGFFLTRTTLAGIEEKWDGSLIVYIPEEEWNDDFKQSLDTFIGNSSGVELTDVEIIEERNWNAEWEASVAPIRATRELVISPSWRMQEALALGSNYLITIDPKMSFGTGHHETTRLVLQAIEEMGLQDKRVLDIGTGSGVLAMYALMRGAAFALGVDTDEWSILNAKENRALNNFSEQQFEIRRGTLDVVSEKQSFDLILANIHRNVLLEIADGIHSHAAPNAALVLSGILIYDSEEIRAAYEKAGFAFVKERIENEWSCLIFNRCA